MSRSPRVHLCRAAGAAVLVVALLACSSGDDDVADPTTTTAPAGGSFSLLTYNVAGLPQEISDVNPGTNIPLISPLLDEYDVVLTQEDFDWWTGDLVSGLDFVNYHDRLRAEATHEYRSPQHPGPEAAGLDPATRPTLNVGDGLGYLSRLPMEGWDRRAWKECFGGFDTSDGGAGDCLAMKGFAFASMSLGDGLDAPVHVYNLHLEAGGSEQDQRLQAADMDDLAAYIEEHSEGAAVIVAGDTNLHAYSDHDDADDGADTEIWEAFLQRLGLTETCAELDCPEPEAIDRVAYRSGDGVTLRATAWERPSERFSDDAGEDLSDHEPVVVQFDWSPA